MNGWWGGRSFYVQIGDDHSAMFDSDVGTIQGSILGPILYALFISPLFDLTQITNFADDNFYIEWNSDLGMYCTYLGTFTYLGLFIELYVKIVLFV